MARHPKQVDPGLLRQDIEKGRMGDGELEKAPGEAPDPGFSEEDDAFVWDDDQR